MLLVCVAAASQAQQGHPIIDMHVHAYGKDRDEGRYGSAGPHGLVGSANQRAHFEETYSQFRKYNIQKAVVTGPPEGLQAWMDWDTEDRIIPGLYMNHPSDYGMSPERFEDLVKAGKVQVFGELGPYYSGTSLSDPEWDPYLEICNRYDIPVGVHTGGGAAGGTYTWAPRARLVLGDPYLIEDVLVKYPKLRIYMMHAGEQWHEHTLRMMDYYHHLYTDIAVLLWVAPNPQRHVREFLANAKEAGVLNRVMFGSDQMLWPEATDLSIEFLNSLDFLTESELRDIYYNNAARFLRLETNSADN